MLTILRDAKIPFMNGDVYIEVSLPGQPTPRVDDGNDERVDAITATAVNLVNLRLIPALRSFIRQHRTWEQSVLGEDEFNEPITENVGETSCTVNYRVDLSVDLPDDEIKRLITETVARATRDAIRLQFAIPTPDEAIAKLHGLVDTLADSAKTFLANAAEVITGKK